MGRKEVTVIFETITPLWTGDAWMKSKKIRPSSLLGSLRFWFEVICYFGGVVKKEDFDFSKGRFEKEIGQKEQGKLKDKLNALGCGFEQLTYVLKDLDICIPSIIFGTTGWKSLIQIKEILPLNDNCFENKLNLPGRICVSKLNDKVKENSDCPKGGNGDWSVFYLSKQYFYGQFSVKFLIEEKILDGIFYPLLKFMNEYGYWGGKWNIGYGRLNILEVRENNVANDNWRQNEKFDFNLFFKDIKGLEFKISEVNNFDELIKFKNNDKKIKILNNQVRKSDLKEVIKELIKTKAKKRAQNKINGGDKEERHKIFGTTAKPPNDEDLLPQGSKILPYIKKENGDFVGGFLSIADLLTLYKEGE
ncbi:protein of unknown function DUF324 [Caldicellulosiruptor hydrothermalis 108]|uniref:CRISPR type III-associated protein domain-containing protein n=1 Tax=Caldicellulosiruptor hydrothermalis (strain DSM 18901 / VKM B-2411 / 108) TaxID=632292 RepID=E4QAG5_CALH1|nr:RAMP superfamily CRISPR-associated protein [Caldicellulosiruptor hydrothermalis]ADQ08269.1 protein of unknown function DUF324 [Caldicellulosiruptor hydrothermalis 108]